MNGLVYPSIEKIEAKGMVHYNGPINLQNETVRKELIDIDLSSDDGVYKLDFKGLNKEWLFDSENEMLKNYHFLKNDSAFRIKSDYDHKEIINVILAYYNRNWSEVLANKRYANLVEVRSWCYYFIREKTSLSYIEIGKLFDRHHATIISSHRRLINLLEVDKKTRFQYEELNKLF